jgi:hypothetical protein
MRIFLIFTISISIASCFIKKNVYDKKASSEVYYIDSFLIVLPEFIIKEKQLQYKLDSLIFLSKNCKEFYDLGPIYPVFFSIYPTREPDQLVVRLMASKDYSSKFIIPGDEFLSLGRDPGFGGINYKGYFIKLEGDPDLFSYELLSGKVERLIESTNDTLAFWGYGTRNKKTHDWVLEHSGWIRNSYQINEGNFRLIYSEPCISGLGIYND